MAYRDYFTDASHQTVPGSGVFAKACAEALTYLGVAKSQKVIDGFTVSNQEKMNHKIRTYKIRGPFSEVRYASRSILSGAWTDVADRKKGIIKPRKKLVDFYLRVTLDKITGEVAMEFTVMGLGRYVNDNNRVLPVSLKTMDKRKTNPFFRKIAFLMAELRPAILAKAEKFEESRERLTGPKGVQ